MRRRPSFHSRESRPTPSVNQSEFQKKKGVVFCVSPFDLYYGNHEYISPRRKEMEMKREPGRGKTTKTGKRNEQRRDLETVPVTQPLIKKHRAPPCHRGLVPFISAQRQGSKSKLKVRREK